MVHPDYLEHIAVLQTRWSRALEASGFDAAIVAAGTQRSYFLDDQSPPWRANPHFAQWLPGESCPQSHLLVRPGQRARLYFYRPADYWHEPPTVPEWIGDALEILVFEDAVQLERAVAAAGSNRPAWIGEGAAPERTGAEQNPPTLLARLHWERACKTPFEVRCMVGATERAVRGHRAALTAFRHGASEFEIHLRYLAAAGQTSEELPYPSIVAQNGHAAVLHYQHYERTPPALRRSFLIDAGATDRGYAADITRTYAVQDAPEGDRFAALVDALDGAQQALIAQIQPGMNYPALHEAAHHAIGRLLAEHGIVRCSAEAAFDRGLTRIFLPHGLGHLLGLQTHDVGGLQADPAGTPAPPPAEYPSLRLTRRIETGQIFTIEPGLYFIPMLLERAADSDLKALIDWQTVERLQPFGGIRIEDNVLVQPAGVRNLTREAFAAGD